MTILDQSMETKQNYAININIKTKDFFEDICNDVERWFDTSNYDKNDKRPPPIGKNKKSTRSF